MIEMNKEEFIGKSINGKVINDVSFINDLELVNIMFEDGSYERYTLNQYRNREITFDGETVIEDDIIEDEVIEDEIIEDEVIEDEIIEDEVTEDEE